MRTTESGERFARSIEAAGRPPVTLLMPNRNNAGVLGLVLERLTKNTTYPDFELVVVDDGSTDGSVDLLRGWRAEGALRSFTLIERDHAGVVEALNAGLAAASGDLVVQLDGDATIETPGWLERMVDFHRSDRRIGAVTPLVVFDSGTIHAAGVSVVSPAGLHDVGRSPPTRQAPVPGTREVSRPDLARSHQVVSRRARAIGRHQAFACSTRARRARGRGHDLGFSPVWVLDHLDLALSFRRLGLKNFFVPDIDVVHHISLRGDRGPASLPRRLRKGARGAVARLTPDRVRHAVRQAERRNTAYSPEQLRRLRSHYAYWKDKWGFDLLNPDMKRVEDLYGSTEVWWAFDEARRTAGERMAGAW